jgi:hypothetical protein
MLTEEKLPMQLKEINCDTGCAKAVYRTAIKRDGVIIHTEYKYEDVMIKNFQNEVDQIISAADAAVKEKIIMEQNEDANVK